MLAVGRLSFRQSDGTSIRAFPPDPKVYESFGVTPPPEGPRDPEKEKVLRMEFQTFRNAFMNIPTQVIRTGRRIVYRVLAWTQWLGVFLRGVDAITRQANRPLRC